MKSFVISLSVLAMMLGLPCAGAEHLYVLIAGGIVYDYNTVNGNHHTFISGLGSTVTMAFDENTNLYVTYQPEGPYSGGVLKVTPDKTVTTNSFGGSPYGVTVGPSNTWVAYPESGQILTLDGTVLANGLEPLALAYDTRTNLYVTDYSGDINRFTNTVSGLSKTVDTFATVPDGPPYALAFDGAGDLFVTTDSVIYEFTNHPSGLSANHGVFADFGNSIEPNGLAFDSSGDLFVTCSTGSLFEFTNTPDGLSTEPTLFDTLSSPSALAIVPALPSLSISAAGANAAISWLAQGFGWSFPWLWPSTNWVLQDNNTLFPNNWTNFSGTFDTNSLIISATISSPLEQDFFRLAHP